MTRIVVLPADETACGFYRMREPARVVEMARPDWEVEVYKPGDVKFGIDPPSGKLMQMQGIPDPLGIDLLVMQRVGTSTQFQLLDWAHRHGIATVVDSDDAMWCIDKDNTAWRAWNGDPRDFSSAHWKWLDRSSEVADVMTVTTKRLADRYGKHGRVDVLPNYVPEWLFDVESQRNADALPSVGWAGFTQTHPHDLKVLQNALGEAREAFPALRVRVIGDAEGAARDWRLDPSQVEEIPPVGLGAPYYSALTSIGLGLVPLRDTPFNRSKSWLKALEMSAAGLPVIASDLPEMRLLARELPIRLAATPGDWYDAITDMVGDWETSQRQGEFARHYVKTHLTYEVQAGRWVRAWERAMKRNAAVNRYREKKVTV